MNSELERELELEVQFPDLTGKKAETCENCPTIVQLTEWDQQFKNNMIYFPIVFALPLP